MPSSLSSRSSFDLAPNRISLSLERARAESRPVLDLTQSNPTRAGIPYDSDAMFAAMTTSSSLRYEPAAFGIASAREAVAEELSARGPRLTPDRLVLTASTSEAYSFLFKLLADPGEEVVVPQPSYPLFEHLAQLESVRVVPYRLAYDGSWHVDLASLRSAVSPRTRAIVTVSPNNPTGSYLKRDELDEVSSLGLPIVSDEVFAPFRLAEGGPRFPSALEASNAPLVFALGGLSKMAGLPQLKVAWIAVAGHEPGLGAAIARLEVVADAFLSVNSPVQLALPAILRASATARAAILSRIRANLGRIRDAVSESPVSLLHVEGGWSATLRLPRTQSEEAWVLSFLEQDGVYVHPGHFFDFLDEAYVVVSLLTPEDTLSEGIARIIRRVGA